MGNKTEFVKEARDHFYIKDEHDYPIFEVQVLQDEKYSHVSCEFKVSKISSWEADGTKNPTMHPRSGRNKEGK